MLNCLADIALTQRDADRAIALNQESLLADSGLTNIAMRISASPAASSPKRRLTMPNMPSNAWNAQSPNTKRTSICAITR